jgi:D-tyrosyl-tRNA(Tyr) deacylase
MRAVVQRVADASVAVSGTEVGRIGKGLLVYLGVGQGDDQAAVDFLATKVANLRIFEDDRQAMNRSLLDVKGEVLVISQFTLFGDCRKGRRPSFNEAMGPEPAAKLVENFVDSLRLQGVQVATGQFGAFMEVRSNNSGPVTILLDSSKVF